MDVLLSRAIAFASAAVLIAAGGCSGRREANPPDETPAAPAAIKLGIMTGSESQAGEEYRAAVEIAERYPHRVMHITFPDNFPRESVTVVAQLSGLAGETKVRAIIVGQAIPGCVAAARRIRASRADMLMGFVTPHEDPDSVARVCDLAIGPDETRRAPELAAAAAGMGARSLVYYASVRDSARPLLVMQRDLLRRACARRGVKFELVLAPDPAGRDGPGETRDFVKEDVPRQLARLGPATAFYATADAVQEPLISALLAARAGFLVEQALPAPTADFPAALGVDLRSVPAAEADSLHALLRSRIAESGMRGHFGTWSASIERVAIQAMAELMMDAVEGRADLHDSTTVARYLAAEAGGPIRMRRWRPGSDYWLVLLERVVY